MIDIGSRARASRATEEPGAAVVEFALVLPILVLLVFGIAEFSRAYNAKISLSGAAREGARVMAITNDEPAARQAVIDAAPTLELDDPSVTKIEFVPTTGCSPGQAMQVDVTYSIPYTIPLFDAGSFTLQGIGVMRCGG